MALALAALLTAASPGAHAVTGDDTISTVAGTGALGSGGDGGPAVAATLDNPTSVAVDGQGNLYIADAAGNRVRKVSGGTITTIAGTGTNGFSGDGGPATSAQLSAPFAVAVDGQGNVYIADNGNRRVRRVSAGGTITTIAGTGVAGSSGDGGPAAAAQLASPVGIAVDRGGNVYVADEGGHRIRRIGTGGVTTPRFISTVAGAVGPGFSGDGGAATSAHLNAPVGVAVDALGSVYIADYGNHRLRRVSPSGVISTVAGTGTPGFSGDGGPATEARLSGLWGVAVDARGDVYVADSDNRRVRRLSGGRITTVAGTGTPGSTGDDGPAADAQLALPRGVAADARGNLYVADSVAHKVRLVANALPVAAFTARPDRGRAPLQVTFDASDSSDRGGTVTSYRWDFGDGGSGSGRVVTHTFERPGSFRVRLTVTDAEGAAGATDRTLVVAAALRATCAGRPATIVGTPGRDRLRGTARRDVIAGLGGADVVHALGGNDLVCAGPGNDVVHGGPGRDVLHGGPGRDRLLGGPGRDVTRQ
jgi:sugar lactone lactonase YvrE